MRKRLCILAPFVIAAGATFIGRYANSLELGVGIAIIGLGLCTVIVGATEMS